MKFSAKKEALADKLSLCSSIAEKRQTIPILSNVLLKANNGNLTIVATDLERQLSLIVSDCSILDDGETTVSARKLFELIRSVPDDTELNFEVIENQLEISALSFQADLAVLPVQDFPFVDLEDHNFNIVLDGSKFGKVLESTSFAMASADVRYYLNGLLFETAQKKINMVATDGHRLAWGSYSHSEDLEDKKIITSFVQSDKEAEVIVADMKAKPNFDKMTKDQKKALLETYVKSYELVTWTKDKVEKQLELK